ncbi:Uncharacterised protein [Mycobacterium tuberculosis]|nr:Uncharacterised protein [Mycobacterium tuberculosis]CKQ72233.1 Uncharacterised protein [Mycobacterium tuberculosis]
MRDGVDSVGVGLVIMGGPVVPGALRDCQNTQALLGEVAYHGFGMFVVDARVGESAARQDRLRSALEHQHRYPVGAHSADRGGVAATGLKRYFGQHHPLRIALATKRTGQRTSRREDRLIGGVRVPFPVMGLRGRARGGPQHLGGGRIGGLRQRIPFGCGAAR